MNPLLLSTYDLYGGAGRAAFRLHQGLQSLDIPSKLWVQNKSSWDASVQAPLKGWEKAWSALRSTLDAFPLKLYPQRKATAFSPQWLPSRIGQAISTHPFDVVNIHLATNGFIPIQALKAIRQPIVWTLHDMWAFTGGCHYGEDCVRYRDSCGQCPQLASTNSWDLSHILWNKKHRSWQNRKITVVTPTHWLADCARKSSLFRQNRIEVIPYGIDLQAYRPMDKQAARNTLNLPSDKQMVMFGTTHLLDKRKGFSFLKEALDRLKQSSSFNNLIVALFGISDKSLDLPYPSYFLGNLSDDLSLSLAYSAADVFVLPSLQDNMPNTILEALACGTPCVAFRTGGLPDLIDHEKDGYLAETRNTRQLADGIRWVLEDKRRHTGLRENARQKAMTHFDSKTQAKRYATLYQESV